MISQGRHFATNRCYDAGVPIGCILFLLAAGIAFSGAASAAERRVGRIEFFGHEGVDERAVRNALPFREGDSVADAPEAEWKSEVRRAVRETTGKEVTDVAAVCCDANGAFMVYIGIAGASYRAAPLRQAPGGSEKLPSQAARLYSRKMSAVHAAVLRGAASEDVSRGYSLSADSAASQAQREIRKFALANEEILYRVLARSGDAEQRAIAADFLGYARQSDRQMAALAEAGSDPNSTVRNNAVRALAVLAASNGDVAARIPVERLGWMLSSGTWTDRNKAALLFDACTRKHAGRAEAALREHRVALQEMARWRTGGHEMSARRLVARARGSSPYCFGLLVRPENPPALPDAELQRIQGEHLAHLGRLHESGWLVAAGPMAKAGRVRGFVISKCASLEEAAEKTGADPAVKAGRLAVEQYLWTGPAEVGDRYRRIKAADPNGKDTMLVYAVVFCRLLEKGRAGVPADAKVRQREQEVDWIGNGLVASGELSGGRGDRVGVAIFDGLPIADAAKLGAASPLVAGGWAEIEALEWYAADGTFADRGLRGK